MGSYGQIVINAAIRPDFDFPEVLGVGTITILSFKMGLKA